jgi:hypothetical protein
VEYFIELCDVLPELKGQVSHQQKERLREVYSAFSTADALEVKQIEAVRVKEGKFHKAIRGRHGSVCRLAPWDANGLNV